MPLNNAALILATNGVAANALFLALHTATPDAAGSNQATSARVAASWPAASGTGDANVTNKNFTGGAANGPVAAVGFWSAVTGGTFYGYQAVTGDTSFNSAGEYTLTSVTLDASAL